MAKSACTFRERDHVPFSKQLRYSCAIIAACTRSLPPALGSSRPRKAPKGNSALMRASEPTSDTFITTRNASTPGVEPQFSTERFNYRYMRKQ